MAIQKVEQAERPEHIKRRATKRKTLPKSDDWQQQIFNVATLAQKPAIALMWATGCRPAEVEAGVRVQLMSDDDEPVIAVTIKGAKISEHSGQPTRHLLIDPTSPEGKAIFSIMGGQNDMDIQRKAKRLNADLADIRQKTGVKVSPYSFRHQVSANLKAKEGAGGADVVAQAMGHATTGSQGRYGSVRQAQSSGTGILHAKATRAVKF